MTDHRLRMLAWTGLVALAVAGPCAASDDVHSIISIALAASPGKPDWLREQTVAGLGGDDAASTSGTDSVQLVVQQDRRDGTDLLTVRYPLVTLGDVRTYAGAGLNQVVYFADSSDPGPTYLSRRNRHRSLGAAAEFGAAWRLSERMALNADLRWVNLSPQANMLRTQDGLAVADEVSVGVSVGWRFH